MVRDLAFTGADDTKSANDLPDDSPSKKCHQGCTSMINIIKSILMTFKCGLLFISVVHNAQTVRVEDFSNKFPHYTVAANVA